LGKCFAAEGGRHPEAAEAISIPFPYALIEAAARGCPVVAPSVGVFEDLAGASHYLRVFPSNDIESAVVTIEGLLETIVYLERSPFLEALDIPGVDEWADLVLRSYGLR
jgi:glycosyltransferase involved in cell wall biosynthesis